MTGHAIASPPYKPVGRCIYCRSPVYWSIDPSRKLGDEHIIARSIGGRVLLPEASCYDCETAINKFETLCTERMFGGAAAHVGVKGRKSKRRRRKLPVWLGKGAEKVMLPLEEHPSTLLMARFATPTILLDLPPKPTPLVGYLSIRPLPVDFDKRIKRVQGGHKEVFLGGRFDISTCALLIAKTAHAFAVAGLGLDGFKPFLADMIRGEAPLEMLLNYLGSGLVTEPDGSTLHEIEFAPPHHYDGRSFAVVRLRLFAQYEMPTHYVVVGELPTTQTLSA